MTMFYRAQKLPGYFHLLAGSKKAIDDLWAYGIPLGWGKELPQSVIPIDAQTNSAYIYSEQKLNFQINGDLTHNVNGKIIPYCANEFHVEHGLTIKNNPEQVTMKYEFKVLNTREVKDILAELKEHFGTRSQD